MRFTFEIGCSLLENSSGIGDTAVLQSAILYTSCTMQDCSISSADALEISALKI